MVANKNQDYLTKCKVISGRGTYTFGGIIIPFKGINIPFGV